MIRKFIIPLSIFTLILNGCATAPVHKAAIRPGLTGPAITAPRVWLESRKALELAGKAGAKYAVTALRLNGVIGPLTVDQKLSIAELLEKVAKVEGLDLMWDGEMAILQPAVSGKALTAALADVISQDLSRKRRAIFTLVESRRVEAIAPLVALVSEKDTAIRRAALLGLATFEGEFMYNQWPGRLSVFELPQVKLDTDTMFWILEEGSVTGGEEWRAVVSMMGRARERQLPRAIWQSVWNKEPGSIMPAIWAMGRNSDPDMRATLEKRLRLTFTNDESDRYMVAATLGKLGMLDVLRDHSVSSSKKPVEPDVRCSAVYGQTS
jgi:hypothetical protein